MVVILYNSSSNLLLQGNLDFEIWLADKWESE